MGPQGASLARASAGLYMRLIVALLGFSVANTCAIGLPRPRPASARRSPRAPARTASDSLARGFSHCRRAFCVERAFLVRTVRSQEDVLACARWLQQQRMLCEHGSHRGGDVWIPRLCGRMVDVWLSDLHSELRTLVTAVSRDVSTSDCPAAGRQRRVHLVYGLARRVGTHEREAGRMGRREE